MKIEAILIDDTENQLGIGILRERAETGKENSSAQLRNSKCARWTAGVHAGAVQARAKCRTTARQRGCSNAHLLTRGHVQLSSRLPCQFLVLASQ